MREGDRAGVVEERPAAHEPNLPRHRTSTLAPMDATVRFVELVNGPTTDVDLITGSLLIAAHDDPDLDLLHQAARVDELAERCPEPTLDGVRRALFDDLRFTGDRRSYYDPANSLLHRVLDRRLGLPITLSVLTIEVGRRIGVPLDGVAMPGHFLVRDRVLQDVFVDPFSGGRLLDDAGCRGLFHSVAGAKAPFRPGYLDPVPGTAILARMAANLVNAYRRSDDRSGLRWAARLRARCPQVSPQELVQLGQALGHAGAYDEAANLLEGASEHLGPGEATRWFGEAARLRARLN